MRSLTVIARNPRDGLFYKGYVATPIKTLETKHVEFDFISPQDVEYQHIICIGGAIPWPELQPGDTVLVRVFNRPSGIVNYVPGTVLHLPNNCHGRKYFTVLIYTCNQVFMVSRQRKDLIKIGREQHKEILDYIFLIRSKSGSNKPVSEPGGRLYIRKERRCKPLVFVNLHPLKEKTERLNLRQPRAAWLSFLHDMHRLRSRATRRPVSPAKPLPVRSKRELLTATVPREKPQQRPASSLSQTSSTQRPASSLSQTSSTQRPTSSHGQTSATQRPPSSHGKNSTSLHRSDSYLYSDTFMSETGSTRTYDIRSNKRSQSSEVEIPKEPEKPKKPKEPKKAKSDPGSPRPFPKPPSPIVLKKQSDSSNETVAEHFEGLKFKKDQVVLARWKDDGWYYYGKYKADTPDGRYRVMDRTGYSEEMQADDIIVDEKYIFQPRDTVVALHKEHIFSYAPGKIGEIHKSDNSEFARVDFYDGTVRDVPIKDQNCEMFKIDAQKYQQVVKYIRECEDRVVRNGSAIARRDDTGFFSECTVKSHTQQSYIVSFNGELKEIPSVYLFHNDRETNRDIKDWKCALVPIDVKGTQTYVPAKVESHGPIKVKLCTQEEPLILHNFDNCFYINETFYTNSVAYINDRKSRQEDMNEAES